MRAVGTIDPSRLSELAAFTANHRITEQVFRDLRARGLTFDAIHIMDEFTHDLVVALPDGLYLVYDTT